MFSGIFACLATLDCGITMAQARALKGKTGASVPLSSLRRPSKQLRASSHIYLSCLLCLLNLL